MKYRIREQNELKPSGVEWLGDIPKDWKLTKLKYLGDAIIGLTYSPLEIVDKDEGILVLRSSNVQNKKITFDSNVYVKKEISKKLLTKIDDILICSRNGSRNLIGKNALINENSKNLTFGAFMTIFRSKYNNYLFYIFNSDIFEAQSASFLSSTINQLTTGNLNNFKIVLPLLDEQKKITDFLDEKSKIFDDAISKKEQLIAKLELAKQALISEVVTGKLKVVESNSKLHTIKRDPNELKPSGVEWVGDIPKEWQVKKLKYLTQLNPNKFNLNEKIKNNVEVSFVPMENIRRGNINLENSKNLNSVINGYTFFEDNDIVIAKVTPCFENHNCAIAENLKNKMGFGSTELNVLRCFNKDSIKFVYYYIQTDLFINLGVSQMTGTGGLKRVPSSFFENFKISLPNLNEQQKISKYLDEKLVHFDNTIEKTKQSIVKLKLAKEALISQAVTGKIEVIEKENKANEYFQRRVLAAYFIDKSQNDISFGRVKLQKMLYMAEAVNHLDFKSDYHRHAMGPLDPIMLHSIESQLKKAKWFEARKIKNGDFEKVEYRALENHAEYLKYLDGRYWKQENIEYIFNLMKGMKTQQAEIVATIHSAYIDLSKQNRVSQENLLDEILNHWHDNKKKIPKENWLKAIEWMSEKQLIKV